MLMIKYSYWLMAGYQRTGNPKGRLKKITHQCMPSVQRLSFLFDNNYHIKVLFEYNIE